MSTGRLVAAALAAVLIAPPGWAFDPAAWMAENAPLSDIRACFPQTDAPQAAAVTEAAVPRRAVVIADGPVETVRGVAEALLTGLPASLDGALVGGGGCGAARLLRPPGSSTERTSIAEGVAGLTAGGGALAASLREAGAALEPADVAGSQLVYVIATTADACGGDAVVAARELREGPAQATVSVVGFEASAADAAALREVAQAGGGRFFEAPTGPELSDWVERTLEELRERTREARALSGTPQAETLPADAAAATQRTVTAARACVARATTTHRVRLGRELLRQRVEPDQAGAVRALSGRRVEAAMLLVDRYAQALQANNKPAADAVLREIENDFSPVTPDRQ